MKMGEAKMSMTRIPVTATFLKAITVEHPTLGLVSVLVDGELLEHAGSVLVDGVYIESTRDDVTALFPRRSSEREALVEALIARWKLEGAPKAKLFDEGDARTAARAAMRRGRAA